MSHILTWILLVGCFVILVLEFQKSGDILLRSFRLDLILAIAALVATTSVITLLWERGTFYTIDIFIAGIVLVDAFVSPSNSFRTALRNWQGGVNTVADDSSE
jgi:hypothetical protein